MQNTCETSPKWNITSMHMYYQTWDVHEISWSHNQFGANFLVAEIEKYTDKQ